MLLGGVGRTGRVGLGGGLLDGIILFYTEVLFMGKY